MKSLLVGVIVVVSLIFLLMYWGAVSGVGDLRFGKSAHTLFGKELGWFTKCTVENAGASTVTFMVDGIDYSLEPGQRIEISKTSKAESRTIYVRVAGIPLPAATVAFNF